MLDMHLLNRDEILEGGDYRLAKDFLPTDSEDPTELEFTAPEFGSILDAKTGNLEPERFDWNLRRLALLRGKEARLRKQMDRELDFIRCRFADLSRPLRDEIAWREGTIEAFHRRALADDPKAKTLKSFCGSSKLRAGSDSWSYTDEEAMKKQLREKAPDLIRTKEEISKGDLRKRAQIYGKDVVIERKVIVPGFPDDGRTEMLILEGAKVDPAGEPKHSIETVDISLIEGGA